MGREEEGGRGEEGRGRSRGGLVVVSWWSRRCLVVVSYHMLVLLSRGDWGFHLEATVQRKRSPRRTRVG